MLGRPLLILVALVGTGCSGHCGARGGLPPKIPAPIVGPDGRAYQVVGKGPYKAYYDTAGRIARLEYDSNGDGKPDQIALHDGQKAPHELDIDLDFDGKIDRWEEYDPAGHLVRLGQSRRNNGRPDVWTTVNAQGQAVRKDYDEDGDGTPERWEYFSASGLLERVEIDTNRNGHPDRWQRWEAGHLVSEDLDTDGDGKPDRRLKYGPSGQVVGLESLDHR
jgi:hypothetical protein